jgi:hypothetical protein
VANKSLRDFIYLDVERVRSFIAQLNEGLPSERSQKSEHQGGIKGSAEGSLPFIAKAVGEADYHYLRSHSELEVYMTTFLKSSLRDYSRNTL